MDRVAAMRGADDARRSDVTVTWPGPVTTPWIDALRLDVQDVDDVAVGAASIALPRTVSMMPGTS